MSGHTYADEQARALRDSTYGTSRNPEYPLITWDYDRAACDAILEEALGFHFPRSCCVWCPFQNSVRGRAELVARWRADPDAGAQALGIERHALALNERMALFGRVTANAVVRWEGLTDVAIRAEEYVEAIDSWSVYEVRRAFSARGGNRELKGTPWRSVKTVATGTRADARTALRELAAQRGLGLWSNGPYGIERAWVRRFPEQPVYPMTEHFYVISQTGADDKKRPGFEERWHEFTSPRLCA